MLRAMMTRQSLLCVTVVMLTNHVLFTFGQSSVFHCSNGTRINVASFCDGINDCDGSDEINVTRATEFDVTQVRCTPTTLRQTCLLHRDYLCNATVTCQGLTPCDVGCPTHYKCQESKKCVLRSTICDGNACNGCPEDDNWQNGVGFKCVRNGRICRLPQQLLWDNIKDCDDGADLCFKLSDPMNASSVIINSQKCFQCLDEMMLVPRHRVCDGTIDCWDLSDECLCERRPSDVCDHVQLRTNQNNATDCDIGMVFCNESKQCIERWLMCDGYKDCQDGFDERFSFCKGTLWCTMGDVMNRDERCRCTSSKCESLTGVLCDGKEDCHLPEGSRWLIEPGFPDDECISRCPNTTFTCTVPAGVGIPIYALDCRTVTTDREGNNRTFREILQSDDPRRCDGIIDCNYDGADEENCDRFLCNNRDLISIPNLQVCDGQVHCDDGSDELESRCSDTRFTCSSGGGTKISVSRLVVCDFIINCDNAEDEMNCTEDGRFYCEDSTPLYVSEAKFLDGIGDCDDWSDECPSQSNPSTLNELSSRYELIGNPILRAVLWIMATLALVGNGIVIFGECKKLRKLFKQHGGNASLRTNHMLVLNLAVADFLMAIYLLMLGIAGAVYSGSYCSQSLSWLTSRSCVAMGVLVVLSSETSVLTMLLLTTSRLYSVLKPFVASRKPKARSVLFMILLCWIVSLFLALLPLSDSLHGSFIERALIRQSPYFGNVVVNFTAAKSFVVDLLTYHPMLVNLTQVEVERAQVVTSWKELIRFVEEKLPRDSEILKVERYFGYSSASSVCAPNFFVTSSDRSWHFSLTISIFNFLAFLYVATVYGIIVVKTRRNKKINVRESEASKKNNAALQRKILRLIITDFCCWIPLSIMVFINFSGVKIDSISYAVAAIVLLPINSALNPILYSNFIDKIYAKVKGLGLNMRPSNWMTGSSTKSTDIVLHSVSRTQDG